MLYIIRYQPQEEKSTIYRSKESLSRYVHGSLLRHKSSSAIIQDSAQSDERQATHRLGGVLYSLLVPMKVCTLTDNQSLKDEQSNRVVGLNTASIEHTTRVTMNNTYAFRGVCNSTEFSFTVVAAKSSMVSQLQVKHKKWKTQQQDGSGGLDRCLQRELALGFPRFVDERANLIGIGAYKCFRLYSCDKCTMNTGHTHDLQQRASGIRQFKSSNSVEKGLVQFRMGSMRVQA